MRTVDLKPGLWRSGKMQVWLVRLPIKTGAKAECINLKTKRTVWRSARQLSEMHPADKKKWEEALAVDSMFRGR